MTLYAMPCALFFSDFRIPTSDFRLPTSMDLLTVLAHELGHVIGREHTDAPGVMAASLTPGERAFPGERLDLTDHSDFRFPTSDFINLYSLSMPHFCARYQRKKNKQLTICLNLPQYPAKGINQARDLFFNPEPLNPEP